VYQISSFGQVFCAGVSILFPFSMTFDRIFLLVLKVA
jgi:hypothetical protein